LAIDVSEEALSLARENAAQNAVRIEFVRSDLLSHLPDWVPASQKILFVANLPYVRQGASDISEDTVFEPPIALYGGQETGFELTERFLEEVEKFAGLHPNAAISVVCEV
jgi:release factor glutamine methyltransferase